MTSASTATLAPGSRLDRYELLCVLAQGGMANVWLARIHGGKGARQLFAIKTILSHVAGDPVFKAMFLDEARIASRIDHVNVVRMVDVGEFADIPYLVMDLVEGLPLQQLSKACERANRRVPLGVHLRILADACRGLHAAHEVRDDVGRPLGIVHRDMSPQNILLSTSGLSKVIDFGVAKALDRASIQTNHGTLKGKISYMPQEQACGREVDRRTDTWALGAVLYNMLRGRPPYKDESQLATLQLAMAGAPIAPLPDSIPLPLCKLTTRALALDPAERFQTASDFADELEALMRRLGIVTHQADVGLFVCEAMGEELEAQRQRVSHAIGEATARERVSAADDDMTDEAPRASYAAVIAMAKGALRPESPTTIDLAPEMETRRNPRQPEPESIAAKVVVEPWVTQHLTPPRAFGLPPVISTPPAITPPPPITPPREATAGAFVTFAAPSPKVLVSSPRSKGRLALLGLLAGVMAGGLFLLARGHAGSSALSVFGARSSPAAIAPPAAPPVVAPPAPPPVVAPPAVAPSAEPPVVAPPAPPPVVAQAPPIEPTPGPSPHAASASPVRVVPAVSVTAPKPISPPITPQVSRPAPPKQTHTKKRDDEPGF